MPKAASRVNRFRKSTKNHFFDWAVTGQDRNSRPQETTSRAWSRSKNNSQDLCGRPGCYETPRASHRASSHDGLSCHSHQPRENHHDDLPVGVAERYTSGAGDVRCHFQRASSRSAACDCSSVCGGVSVATAHPRCWELYRIFCSVAILHEWRNQTGMVCTGLLPKRNIFIRLG